MTDTLDGFVHEVVLDSKDSKRLASLLGKSRNLLLNELNPANDRNKAGLELLLPAMEICDPGDTIMHFLSRQRGGVFLRLSVVEGAQECRRQFMEAMGELGALVRSFEHAQEAGGPAGEKVAGWELEQFEAQAQAALTGLQRAVVACRAELENRKEE